MKTAVKNTRKKASAKTTKAKTTKAKTVKPSTRTKKAKLDSKNVKDTITKVVKSKREIKYNYPSKVSEPLERKKWRQKVRNELYAFERKIARLEGKAKSTMEKEYKNYREDVLLVP